ncbi:AsmA-like C-terminal region-containing protein [Polaribacter septentrionalilitoris]|uniref:AsmA-like C-terminal region-containing protein n=1 Tax=Polaribacter septentrionalilitoris TaxID=2494657 RepID=UPI00135B3EB2|nr:AsmA-like C-terminal region-containing protein [Polaribacter septentrionalilitoris]
MSKKKKKQSIGKKILKWFSITCLVLLIALIAIPYLFKDKIVAMVTKTINNNINATVAFKNSDLSLIKHFPLASLTVDDVSVANKAPFLGDTLYNAKKLSLDMKITELFKKPDESIEIKNVTSENGTINIIFNTDGKGNFDIAKKETTTVNSAPNSSFSFNINEYQLGNIDFNYIDRATKMNLSVDSIYHSGKGNFKEDIFNLDTKSIGFLSFSSDQTNFINNVKVSLDAILEINLKKSKYTFKENTGYINQLPLAFDGFIQLVEENQLYDIHFKTPTSSFKNALALIPTQYSGNLKTIQTKGNFDLEGTVKGTLSETTIPKFNINISSKNAMFKYADLPKSVQNININSQIINATGYTKDTYVAINTLNFKVDEDEFSANGNIKKITTNPQIDFNAKGTINLANISKVYPISLENELSGVLTANVATNFDMNAIEKKNYQKIKNSGTIGVNNFKYDSKDIANPFYIDETKISFNTKSIQLKEFKAKTGVSDLAIKGQIDNFYGFIFKDEVLKGNFNLNSNNFKVSDFLTQSEKTDEKDTSLNLKIPVFLDCKFSANAKNVVYDNMNMKNVSGDLYIHDETVDLKNLKSDVFGGNIAFSGNVSTKEKTPKFEMSLDLNKLNISESFGTLEMLKSIAPIAETIGGKINSKINLSGVLKDDFTPNLSSISGDLFGKLLDPKLNSKNSKVLNILGDKVDFIDVNKLNLDGINAYFSFKNGQVTVKPIPFNYKDINIEVGGTHNFENTMNYDIVFDVPVKYLGTDVTNLISKLTPKDAADIKNIPVKASLTGSFGSPKFSSNIKDATSNLMKNLIEKQKQSLINQGKDKVKDVLGGLFGKKKKDTVQKKN